MIKLLVAKFKVRTHKLGRFCKRVIRWLWGILLLFSHGLNEILLLITTKISSIINFVIYYKPFKCFIKIICLRIWTLYRSQINFRYSIVNKLCVWIVYIYVILCYRVILIKLEFTPKNLEHLCENISVKFQFFIKKIRKRDRNFRKGFVFVIRVNWP